MTKKALDKKYSYQIDEHDIVHLFRGEDDCQQYLTNPLLSAIFKIEELEKENAELKKINVDGLSELNHINGDLIIENEKLRKEIAELKELLKDKSCLDCNHLHNNLKLTKAKELLTRFVMASVYFNGKEADLVEEAEDFLKETEE